MDLFNDTLKTIRRRNRLVSIQYQQGFLSVLQRTSMPTLGDSLSVHQDTVEDPVVVLAPILSPLVDKTLYRVIRKISKFFNRKIEKIKLNLLFWRIIIFSFLFFFFFFFPFLSDKGSGHGILEFSTDKAGQDVTPLNLEFDEPKQRSSTLNSITGEKIRVYSVDRNFFPLFSSFFTNSLSPFLFLFLFVSLSSSSSSSSLSLTLSHSLSIVCL